MSKRCWECLKKVLGMSKNGFKEVNDGRNLTNGNGFGNFVGISWEKLGTFRIDCEGVTFLFGNFVGITWE
jgi:hypothetical protein